MAHSGGMKLPLEPTYQGVTPTLPAPGMHRVESVCDPNLRRSAGQQGAFHPPLNALLWSTRQHCCDVSRSIAGDALFFRVAMKRRDNEACWKDRAGGHPTIGTGTVVTQALG
ncbi:hypothetical protein AAFF_G00397690 [Aldrovandia affinis]|uniref:Uncharacterized protein n=1 Tax=Aldrovandia affinis TaxID=143900 RepID=A0AAD7SFC7_9TELE|nr:hypothetical protein AAFF_G00397690 [Aldrovandia affinis]